MASLIPVAVLRDKARRAIPTSLGVLTLVSMTPLVMADISPRLFPTGAHGLLAAVPLVLIVVAYVISRPFRWIARVELAKGLLWTVALLFLAASRVWSNRSVATLCNDLAIATFVVAAFLLIVGRPPSSPRAKALASGDAQRDVRPSRGA